MSEFRLGDKVSGHGLIGEVIGYNARDVHPITVRWETRNHANYTEDGKQYTWHKEPAIKLISRKVKVKKEMWVNIYGSGQGYGYPSKEEAEQNRAYDYIPCQKFTYEIEAEEVCE